jgi:hypothetical protein
VDNCCLYFRGGGDHFPPLGRGLLIAWMVFLFMTYEPFFTIIPFFVHSEEPALVTAESVMGYFFLIGYLAYNAFWVGRVLWGAHQARRLTKGIARSYSAEQKTVGASAKFIAYALLS